MIFSKMMVLTQIKYVFVFIVLCHDVTVLVVLFVVAAAGQLGAAGRYEPLALAEMQSGNNFHRFELHAEKKKK